MKKNYTVTLFNEPELGSKLIELDEDVPCPFCAAAHLLIGFETPGDVSYLCIEGKVHRIEMLPSAQGTLLLECKPVTPEDALAEIVRHTATQTEL